MAAASQEGRAAAWWRRASPGRRLRLFLLPLALSLAGVGAFHFRDARSRGEPVWPVVLATALVVLVLAGGLWLAQRPVAGLAPDEAIRLRTRWITRWAVPIAVALALVSAVARVLVEGR